MSVISNGLPYAIEFPKTPAIGQVEALHGTSYRWTGLLWSEIEGSGSYGDGSGTSSGTATECSVTITPQKAFTPLIAVASIPGPDVPTTVQSLQITGSSWARITGHVAYRNTSPAGTGSSNITTEMYMNGSPIGGHYLGAVCPAADADGALVQIPVTITNVLTGLNPLQSYTITLVAKKQDGLASVSALDTYLEADYNKVACTGVEDPEEIVHPEWNNIPQIQITANYTLEKTNTGKHILINAGTVTVPSGIFDPGDVVVLVNNTQTNKNVTLSAVAAYWPNGTTSPGYGNRVLSPRAVCTLMCLGSDIWSVTGQGVL